MRVTKIGNVQRAFRLKKERCDMLLKNDSGGSISRVANTSTWALTNDSHGCIYLFVRLYHGIRE